MKSLNLASIIDENLREVAVNAQDVAQHCDDLGKKILKEENFSVRAALLAELGSFQRILGRLEDAEASQMQCLAELKKASATDECTVSAEIRLAHVYHWQKRFEEANDLFAKCISNAQNFGDHGLVLSFALQHYGKCLFDQYRYEEAIRCFYDAMMIRVRLGRDELADSSRVALEAAIERVSPPPAHEIVTKILADSRTPTYVHEALGGRVEKKLRTNCMNAAMNFHSPRGAWTFEPRTTAELLDFLNNDCQPLSTDANLMHGDLIAYWSRTNDDRSEILVSQLKPDQPGFPFGIVFEHIAVYLGNELVFHKPNPSIDVPHKISKTSSVLKGFEFARGFAKTFHRKKLGPSL